MTCTQCGISSNHDLVFSHAGYLCEECQQVFSLIDFLDLVSVTVDANTVRGWTTEQSKAVEKWAAKCILRANDNHVRVPPKPEFLP